MSGTNHFRSSVGEDGVKRYKYIGPDLGEWICLSVIGGPYDNSNYALLEGRLPDCQNVVLEKDGQYYMYMYDDVIDAMIYVEQVYMNEEGIIEYE